MRNGDMKEKGLLSEDSIRRSTRTLTEEPYDRFLGLTPTASMSMSLSMSMDHDHDHDHDHDNADVAPKDNSAGSFGVSGVVSAACIAGAYALM